jgi:hypothetical protein
MDHSDRDVLRNKLSAIWHILRGDSVAYRMHFHSTYPSTGRHPPYLYFIECRYDSRWPPEVVPVETEDDFDRSHNG